MTISLARAALAAPLTAALLVGAAAAQDLDAPEGQVLLTVIGAIENANREPFDPFLDPFTNYHDRKFDQAAAFDLAMLKELGMHEVTVEFADWPRPVTIAGPRLDDLLGAVGAENPERLMTLALDGFQTEIAKEDLDARDWIVGVEESGAPLGIGQRGPVWLVFAPADDAGVATEEEEMSWPWAAFLFEIE